MIVSFKPLKTTTLAGRKFSDPVEKATADILAERDISLCGLAKAQVTVYNALKDRSSRQLLSNGLMFFGTAPAYSWGPVFNEIVSGGVPQEVPEEYRFTNLEVSAFDNVEEKLLALSTELNAAREEYERTKSPAALERFNQLAHDLELIATAKVHSKAPRRVPSLSLKQDSLQREIEELLQADPTEENLARIKDLDYKVTEIQYEREFIKQVESGFSQTMGYLAAQETNNLALAFEASQFSGIADKNDIASAMYAFAELPFLSRNESMAAIEDAMAPAIANAREVQSQLAQASARSSKVKAMITARLAKETKKQTVRLGHKIQHIMTDYSWMDNDVAKSISSITAGNPILKGALDGICDGIGGYDPALKSLFAASSTDINITKVALLLEVRQLELDATRILIREGRSRVFNNWNGDKEQLRQRIEQFSTLFSKNNRKRLQNAFFAKDDFIDAEKRKEIMAQMKSELENIVKDPEVVDMRKQVLAQAKEKVF